MTKKRDNHKPDSGEKSDQPFGKFRREGPKKKRVAPPKGKGRKPQKRPSPSHLPMRINRFISLAGVCSRREADTLIEEGKVSLNGKKVTSLGVKVDPEKDTVMYNGKKLSLQTFVYLLLNKPKDHITTLNDEKNRKTVMDIVRKHTRERVYPVGRLDRNTTGLLLFTNDGALTEKLTHPGNNVKKTYHVKLDKPFDPEHMEELVAGIELEDGPIKPDEVGYIAEGGPEEIGIEIHSGRNRIVRRIFEHFGYKVKGLDRVRIGPLTKKNLPRGKVRPLTSREVGWLNMIK